jgi:hypothetical protein
MGGITSYVSINLFMDIDRNYCSCCSGIYWGFKTIFAQLLALKVEIQAHQTTNDL